MIQSQIAECGLACIARVASAHGQSLRLNDVPQRFPQSVKWNTVMQEDVLLTGNVADNIAFFVSFYQQRTEVCGQLAQLHHDFVRMPMGYQSLVGELGSGLSGG